jgi:5-methylthioadenosine/S-adenosylhomocysteine deaminase
MLLRFSALWLAAAVAFLAQPARRDVALVITDGIVVTMDGSGRVLSPGAVVIDGRDIVAVDTPDRVAAQFSPRETIDAAGQVVMPGLVNTHTHAPMVM